MKKILITGCFGLVGSEAMDFFEDKGWEVIGIDNNTRSKLFNTQKHTTNDKSIQQIDIRDQKKIEYLFKSNKFDAIIHAAAQPSHDYSKDHVIEDFEINALGTLYLLEAARQYCPTAPFVFVSTDKVYGTNMNRDDLLELPTRFHSEQPFAEDLGLDEAMRSPFGCSKTAADVYVQEYGYYFGMNTVCFRPGCITGKNHEGAELHGFLAYLAKCIRTGTPYKMFGYKGKQVRDQIHAYDLVNAFYHFIEQPQIAQVYNMGGGPQRAVSIIEAIKLIERETGKSAIIEYHESERKGDRIWDVHDVSAFQQDYPEWNYTYSLQDIIKDVCEKAL